MDAPAEALPVTDDASLAQPICHARADTFRAAVAMLVPVAVVAFGIAMLLSKGHAASDYFSLIRSGKLWIVRQGVGWIGLVFWVLRFYPPAWSALWHGPCLIRGDDEGLAFVESGQRVRYADIVTVRFTRGVWRQAFEVETLAGRIVTSLIFVHKDCDEQLRAIAARFPSSA